MFASIAMLLTAYVPSLYSFNYYYSLFVTPMFFLSGVFFPLSSFPPVVQNLSWIAPLTPVVHVSRALVSGHFPPDVLPGLGLMVALTVIAFPLSLVSMRRRLTV